MDEDNRKHNLDCASFSSPAPTGTRAAAAAGGETTTSTLLLPSNSKKRRIDASADGEDNESGPGRAHLDRALADSNEENDKLRKQVKGLKEIVCLAFGGKLNPPRLPICAVWEQRYDFLSYDDDDDDTECFDFHKQLSDDIRKDGEIVAAAVRGGYVDWWTLSDELKYDACVSAAVMSEYSELDSDRRFEFLDFMELSAKSPGDVMLAAFALFRTQFCAQRWSDVPNDWQRMHKGLALFGVVNEFINADDCPCLLDRDFMRTCIEKGALKKWNKLPTELQCDVDFARSIQVFPSAVLYAQLFSCFPDLFGDRTFWRTVVDSAATSEAKGALYVKLSSTIRHFAPVEILSDRELMINACSVDEDTLFSLDDSFTREHDFLLACVHRNPHCFDWIFPEVQRLFPDVVDRALSRYMEIEELDDHSIHKISSWVESMAPEFWCCVGLSLACHSCRQMTQIGQIGIRTRRFF